jgi:hypothetical protein
VLPRLSHQPIRKCLHFCTPLEWLKSLAPGPRRFVNPPGTGDVLDFIGPSIDAGFRLTKFSTPKKFVLAADLALMLLDAIHRTEVAWDQFHLFYDGAEQLKGVLDGEPYPIVWLDMHNGAPDIEETLLGISKPTLPHLLRQFLAKFVDRKMTRPFIEGDDESTYGRVSAPLQMKRDRMQEMESQVVEVGKGHEQSSGQEPDLPAPRVSSQGFLPGVP